jgi:regulator of sigma E protease
MDLNWLWVIPVLGILIIVHEAGHFFTAIWLGIRVEEFGIGFPPRLFAIRRNGIDYSLNALPIGGFVKITGENGDSEDPRSFGRAPAWKRIIVLAAGSFMNLLLAIIIFAILSVMGTQQIDAPLTTIGQISGPGPAQTGGMQEGDHILSVAGTPVANDEELRRISQLNGGKPTEYVVERNGERLTLTVTPNREPPSLGVYLGYYIPNPTVRSVRDDSPAKRAGLQTGDKIVEVNGKRVTHVGAVGSALEQSAGGVVPIVVERNGSRRTLQMGVQRNESKLLVTGLMLDQPIKTIYYSPWESLGRSLNDTWTVITLIPRGIGDAIGGRAEGPGVTGIVGISQLTGEVAQDGGISGLLRLTALLGISLFMINLLPLPALDGGRLLFIFIELLRGGKRIAPEKEGLVHFAGMVVLLALMLLITAFDVGRLLGGERLLP